MSNKYYIDSDVLTNGTHYYYYVEAVDDAGEVFKYPDPPYTGAPVINSYNNESDHSVTVDLNPQVVVPTISLLDNDKMTKILQTGVSTATIYWETNQPTESLVSYRKSGTQEEFVVSGREGLTTAHTVMLRALEAGTTYEYRVSGKNSIGNDKRAGYGTTDTNVSVLATSPFSISGVVVEPTTTTATVRWQTSIAADSSVEYKAENSNQASQTAGDPGLVTAHEVLIKSLKPATTYTYKIRSVTADNYIADTQFASFATKPNDASQFVISPDASNIAEENITATSAKIVWNTAVATTTWVDFGTSSESYRQSAGENTYNTVHVVELKNLTPGTTYYYKVRGMDTNDVEYTSQEYKFTAVLKPEIQNLNVDILDPYTAKVTFTTNVDTETSVSFGEGGKFDQKAGVGAYAKIHQIELKNLLDNMTYTYYVDAKDKIGNSTKTEARVFSTPIDTTGPEVKEVKIDMLPLGESDEFAQAIISWTTSKPSTTKLEYGEGVISGRYEKSSIPDNSLNTSHTVIVKDLNPATTYHVRIVSVDKRGNQTTSSDYTFVSPTKEKSILQLILKSLEETFSWVGNIGQFFRNIGKKAS
jgi:hypothetical protein